MNRGESWAYRARATDAVVPVEVLAIGTARPPRVRVRHLLDEAEGREEWVPPARLKVLWSDVEPWLAREERWEAVRRASREVDDTAEYWAASMALEALPAEVSDLISSGYNKDAGVLMVTDVAAVARRLELDPAVLTGDPLCFVDDDGTLIAPWSVSRALAHHVAARFGDQIIAQVVREEAKEQREAVYGSHHPGRNGGWYTSPEVCAEIAAKYKPSYALLREWCGASASERVDELQALRSEVRRLGALAELAVMALRDAGLAKAAADVERELGVPIEALRGLQRHDQ